MYEWSLVAEGDAVSEISCVNGVMRKERIIMQHGRGRGLSAYLKSNSDSLQ